MRNKIDSIVKKAKGIYAQYRLPRESERARERERERERENKLDYN